MPIYISRGRFTSDAVKGMLAKPENREEAVAKLFKNVGGRLIGWYLTFGHHDWLAIAEFPDEKAAASAILAAAAGGRVVGAFPDGQSCLNLAAARLRYIVGTAWSTKCYMNMRPLYQPQLMQTEAVA